METDRPEGSAEGSAAGSAQDMAGGFRGRRADGSSGDSGGAAPGAAARVAAALLWAQVAVVAGFVAFFVIEFALGQASDPAAVLTSLLVFVLGALGLALLARGWARGARWPRTPTLVWHALLLPIGWSLAETHHLLVAAGVLGVGGAGLVASWRAPAEPRPAAGGRVAPDDREPSG